MDYLSLKEFLGTTIEMLIELRGEIEPDFDENKYEKFLY